MGRRVSPDRAQRSPRRKSPLRREKSPAQDRSLNEMKHSSRHRSPKHDRSRSPVNTSRSKEKPSGHTKSPKRRRSPSPVSPSPVRHRPSGRTRSPPISPTKGKLAPRTRSPKRANPRSSVSRSPERGRPSIRTRSPRTGISRSPESRSPSLHDKRVKRAKTERDAEKGSEREHEKNHGRKGDGSMHKEKHSDRELPNEKRDRRAARDGVDNGSSRSRHGRSTSPSNRHRRGPRKSRSPSSGEDRGRDEPRRSRDDEQQNGENDSMAKMKAAEETLEAKEKHKPSFELSGKLAEETNRYRGVTLLFNEPPEARKPDIRWRLYVFKGGEVLNEPLYVHRQSCYLFGRERRVADIPTDHPSCSKQHAVLQYRQVEQENPDGSMSKKVRPYLMDLGSTNGTFINDDQLEARRYYELFEKDTIKFGNSSREYVLLHEHSTG